MAIASGVEFNPASSQKEYTLDEALKRANIVKNLEGTKLKDIDPKTEKNETESAVNELAEQDFDDFVKANKDTIATFVKKGTQDTEGKQWIKTEFQKYIANHLLAKYISDLKDDEISKTINETKFELDNLSAEINRALLNDLKQEITPTNETTTTLQDPKETLVDKNNTYGYKPDSFVSDELGQKGKLAFEYDDTNDIDKPTNEQDILNIYKKGGLHKEMEALLGNLGELSPRTFKINLSPVNGLAGLVLNLEKNNARENVSSGRDIKRLDGFTYVREGGLDYERGKLAKIIKHAQEDPAFKEKLIAFAHETESFGPEYEKGLKQDINFHNKTASEHTIIKDLCDYNGDGLLSVKYRDYIKRGQHKEQWKAEHTVNGNLPGNWRDQWKADWFATKEKQKMSDGKNQGDVGSIFGPQLYDALQTAINVAQTKVENKDKQFLANHPGVTTGEAVVVFNVLKNIRIATTDPKLSSALDAIQEADCSRSTLATLCNEHSSFQPLFAQTIERINGSSSDIAPDLVDRLLGRERLPQVYPSFADKLGQDPFDKVLASLGKNALTGESVHVGDREFIQMRKGIMTFLDNVKIDAMLTDQGHILNLSGSKSWDLNKRRHEMENSFLKTLLGAMASITINPTTGTVGFTFGESGATQNLKTKWAWNGGVNTLIGSTVLSVSVGAEYAHQFNYAHIVTSSLDDLGKSRYIGVAGGASEIFIGVAPVETTVEGGLQYQQDSKAAIEQVYKQYSNVIEKVFTGALSEGSLTSPDTLEATLMSHFNAMYKGLNGAHHLMAKFIDNNRKYFETNIQQLAHYFGKSGILSAVKASEHPVQAAEAVVRIFTQGVVNNWRETMYERMAGKTEISKVQVGLGGIFMANVIPIVYPKIGLSLRHRRNNYISVQAQKQLDANIINAGKVDKEDTFLPDPPTIPAYARYLESVFSLTDKETNQSLLTATETPPGCISLTCTKGNISDIIDIRSKVQQSVLDNCAFSVDGKTLIIGNVGNITAYTQSDGLGKRCFLILGGQGTQKTCRLPVTHNHQKDPTTLAPMTFTETVTKTEAAADTKEDEATKTKESSELTIEKTLKFESLLSPENKTDEAESKLQTMVKQLMDLEQRSPHEYSLLIRETSNGLIDSTKLNIAVSSLDKMFVHGKFTQLSAYLKAASPDVQAYMVDRCKQIFAKEVKYSKSSIGQILKSHKAVREVLTNLKGPSKEAIPAELADELVSKRDEWKSDTSAFADTPTQDPQLIGYSAFYRRNTTTHTYISKNFSLTSLGGTTHQGELYTIKEHPDQAKDWVLANLKNNQQECKTLKDRITKLCEAEQVTVNLDAVDWIDNLLNGTLAIDKSDKKIRLNVDWVFYLLGECCNESLGMKIQGLDILIPTPNPKPEPHPHIPSEVVYTSSTHIQGRNLSSAMRVGSYGEDLSLSTSIIRTEKREGDKTTPGADETQEGDHTGPGIQGTGGGGNSGSTPGLD